MAANEPGVNVPLGEDSFWKERSDPASFEFWVTDQL